jgi:hypothetical protein
MVIRDGRPKKARIRSNSAIVHIMRSKSWFLCVIRIVVRALE